MRFYIKSIWVGLLILLVCTSVSAQEFRIAIKGTDYAGLTHDQIILNSIGQITLVDYHNNYVFTGPVTFTPVDDGIMVSDSITNQMMSTPIWVYPEHEISLVLETVLRGSSNARFYPEYRGFMEISLLEESLLLINTVTVEQYLYSVVPSEMNHTWPQEALKAQAIASRTYIIRAIINADAQGRKYHVDDSVFAQVYNNQRENIKTTQVVDDTAGIVMLDQNNQLVQAYFFSTSCGYTAAAHQVWGGSTRSTFPGIETPYLIGAANTLKQPIELKDETEILRFFQDRSVASYEYDSPWFRWDFTLTRQEIEAIINANFAAMYRQQPEFILTKTAQGEFISQPIPQTGIGELQAMQVIERGNGYNVMILEITGSTGTYRISKEYNIRTLLQPTSKHTGGSGIVINRTRDRVVDYGTLPSASVSFVFEWDQENNIKTITFYGGGSGHGVGLSQWGAKGLAEAGFAAEQILQSFYQGVSFINIDSLPH